MIFTVSGLTEGNTIGSVRSSNVRTDVLTPLLMASSKVTVHCSIIKEGKRSRGRKSAGRRSKSSYRVYEVVSIALEAFVRSRLQREHNISWNDAR